ncbi:hypothetical protein [Niallia sp.]|uniref:hypothetical protein n=1 Tax=Niallia sp. TaxID=2837523 RepID=UPI00289A6D20|nr:hypothetical protein [Niallia sp.]
MEKKNEADILSFTANKKWLSLPKEMRSELERNVWCSSCIDVVQIENYLIEETKFGIVLQGTCKQCGKQVARAIEMD